MEVNNNLDFSGHISNVRKKTTCNSQLKDGAYKGIFARFTEYAGKADLNKCY